MKPLLLFTIITCLHLGCNKHERIYQTHVKGCVTDYFDGTKLQDVQVAIVYTYDYVAYNCGGCHLLVPDTVAQGTTNSKGEFSLKFRPLRFVSKTNGIAQSPFGAPKKCGYLLVLYKPGTDYFTQYYNLHNGWKGSYHIDYKLKPMVTIQCNVKAVNNKTTYVSGSIRTSSNYKTSKYPIQHSTSISGVNINASYAIKTEWEDEIYTAVSLLDTLHTPQYSNYIYDVRIKTIPTSKLYSYDATY